MTAGSVARRRRLGDSAPGNAPPDGSIRVPCSLRIRSGRGQASVELVALLPLTLLLAFAVATVLAARSAAGQAGAAAQAGAMALIQDADPSAAARVALPAAARDRASIRVHDRAVTVTVRPSTPIAFLRASLAATSSAHAGPEPPP